MQGVAELYASKQLLCFGDLTQAIGFEDAAHFTAWCKQQQFMEWVVYAKPPFAGPKAVLKYLSRYTHRDSESAAAIHRCNTRHVYVQGLPTQRQ